MKEAYLLACELCIAILTQRMNYTKQFSKVPIEESPVMIQKNLKQITREDLVSHANHFHYRSMGWEEQIKRRISLPKLIISIFCAELHQFWRFYFMYCI